jgi:hypothetical protein
MDLSLGALGSSKEPRLGFMHKLVKILSNSDPAVVAWSAAGDSFIVRDPRR